MYRFTAKAIFFLTIFQWLAFRLFAQDPGGDYRSISQITQQLSGQYGVRIFYKPEWFEKRNFHFSVANLPLNEALDNIAAAAGVSVVVIDSTLVVFVSASPVENSLPLHDNAELRVIGNPGDFGKYVRASVRGRILDGRDGQPLPGASVMADQLKTGTIADGKGNYQLTLPVGEHTLRITFLGYEDNLQKINLVSDGSFDGELFEKSVRLDEVIISSRRAESNVTSTQMSLVTLDSKAIKALPGSFGESDIIRNMASMPGVQTIGEIGTGFNVRGGSADQNLILVEDAPLFNSSHMFGLISVVGSEGVTGVTLMKAGIPARYGERASSVLDIRMGTENQAKASVKGGIGLINSRLHTEIPLFHGKAVFMAGVRSSYSNWLLHLMPDADLKNSSARFYDGNAQLAINLNQRNRISLFTYYSHDRFGFSREQDYQYSNLLGSIRWQHTFSDRLFFELTGATSNYKYEVAEKDTARLWEGYSIRSSLSYNSLKWNFSWYPNKLHAVDFGLNVIRYRISPGERFALAQETTVKPMALPTEQAAELAAYFSDQLRISKSITMEAGVRAVVYSPFGPGKVYRYDPSMPRSRESIVDSTSYAKNKSMDFSAGLEPRLAFRFSLSEYSSLKMSYNRMHQYINLISNTAVMTPSDVWKLSTPNRKPLVADHLALGYFRNFRKNTVETSVEIYYKGLAHVPDYRNGASILLNPWLESEMVDAEGKNYGVELYIRKNSGRMTGWLTYTYSRAMLRTSGTFREEMINNNQFFPANHDKPHSLFISMNYELSRRWRFGGSFQYATGRPVTLPELTYTEKGYQLIAYSLRNEFRLPAYHRLDLFLTLDQSLRVKKFWKGSWTLSVMNVYGRKNVYSVFYKKEEHMVSFVKKQYDTYKLYILGRPIPTLTYNFYF